jgi:hypothetical protein
MLTYPMKLNVIIHPAATPQERRILTGTAVISQDMREAFNRLKDHYGPALVGGDVNEVTFHRPAQDGASGPIGHLGVCIGRIIPHA